MLSTGRWHDGRYSGVSLLNPQPPVLVDQAVEDLRFRHRLCLKRSVVNISWTPRPVSPNFFEKSISKGPQFLNGLCEQAYPVKKTAKQLADSWQTLIVQELNGTFSVQLVTLDMAEGTEPARRTL